MQQCHRVGRGVDFWFVESLLYVAIANRKKKHANGIVVVDGTPQSHLY